ncbi:MAG TPA: endonuclease/exonuclease/phosphatase family protein [Geminicoccaceae bacterium]
MKRFQDWPYHAACLTLAALLVLPLRPAAAATCDAGERGALNVLTINLLFSEIEMRDDRLRAIAGFAAESEVDVILLQEVVGGALVETTNSARDLRNILSGEEGLDYELHTAVEAGVPGVLLSANAVLSRCDISRREVAFLPPARELDVDGGGLPFPRNVMLSRLDVPDFGRIDVYNTHACSDCTARERDRQIRAILEFIEATGVRHPSRPVVFGGDLNLDRLRGAAHDRTYRRIVAHGFIDGYAEAVADPLDSLCEDTLVPDEHCTFGVTPLRSLDVTDALALLEELPFLALSPLLFELLLEDLEEPGMPAARRIDYVFARGFGPVQDGLVVFNPEVVQEEPAVSDHAGVFVSLGLPASSQVASRR